MPSNVGFYCQLFPQGVFPWGVYPQTPLSWPFFFPKQLVYRVMEHMTWEKWVWLNMNCVRFMQYALSSLHGQPLSYVSIDIHMCFAEITLVVNVICVIINNDTFYIQIATNKWSVVWQQTLSASQPCKMQSRNFTGV